MQIAKTQRKHLRAELDRSATEATSKIAQSRFRMVTEGSNVAAAILWRARAVWREKQRIEHELAGSFAMICGVSRADDLMDDQLARVATSGRRMDADESEGPGGKPPARTAVRRSNTIGAPADDITADECTARHAPRPSRRNPT